MGLVANSPTVVSATLFIWRDSQFAMPCLSCRTLHVAQRLRYIWRDGGDHAGEHLWCAGDDVWPQFVLLGPQRADPTSRLQDHQGPGGRIPGLQSKLPEPIGATGRDISQIERG